MIIYYFEKREKTYVNKKEVKVYKIYQLVVFYKIMEEKLFLKRTMCLVGNINFFFIYSIDNGGNILFYFDLVVESLFRVGNSDKIF